MKRLLYSMNKMGKYKTETTTVCEPMNPSNKNTQIINLAKYI